MKTIEGVGRTSAPPEAVWPLLADASRWSEWGSWSKVEIEGGAEHGPGAIRVLHQAPFHVRERVTDWEPNRRMGYEMVEGMNVHGYRSTVTLEPAPDGGTTIRWQSTYDKAGLVTAQILKLAVRTSPKRLAKFADRR